MANGASRHDTRWVTGGILLVCGCAWLAAPARTEPLNPPSERFHSSLEFGIDMEIEERDTIVRGSIPSRSFKDEFASAAFRLGWQGEGGAVDAIWGSPRPFVRAGLKWIRVGAKNDLGNYIPTEPDDSLAAALRIGIAGTPNQQQNNRRLREGLFTNLADFEGVQIDYRDGPMPGFYSGVGLSFDLEVPGSEFPGWVSFKPGLEWSMRRYILKGGVTQYDVTAVDPPLLPRAPNEPPIAPGTMFPAVYEVVHQVDTFSFWEHRLGPSFELETGLRDREGFAISLFLAARLQFLVSRGLHTWGASNGISKTEFDRRPDVAAPVPLDASNEVVRFRSQSHSLIVSLGGGLRFHWF